MATMTDAMRVLGDVVLGDPRLPGARGRRRSTACASAPGSGWRSRPTSRGARTGPGSRPSSPSAGSASTSGRRGCCASASACTTPRSWRSPRRCVSGREAHELGLVNAVVPADELDAATAEVVDDDRGRTADRARADEARARRRLDVVARAGARAGGAGAERERADRRHARGDVGLRRAPPAELHGHVGSHGDRRAGRELGRGPRRPRSSGATSSRAMGGDERLQKHRGAGQARRPGPHRTTCSTRDRSSSSARSSAARMPPPTRS